jgi:hypothetical protein
MNFDGMEQNSWQINVGEPADFIFNLEFDACAQRTTFKTYVRQVAALRI